MSALLKAMEEFLTFSFHQNVRIDHQPDPANLNFYNLKGIVLARKLGT